MMTAVTGDMKATKKRDGRKATPREAVTSVAGVKDGGDGDTRSFRTRR